MLNEHLESDCPNLLSGLISGYDIELVIDLVRGTNDPSRLPITRTGLYLAILTENDEEYPVERLGLLAWKKLIEGKRVFSREDPGMTGLLQPLESGKYRVIISVSKSEVEFRHDQMRTYLAAFWLVRQAINVESLTMHLERDEVWRVTAEDQDELWPFVAELLPSNLLAPVWLFCVAEKRRERFQHALQEEATKREMKLFVPLVERDNT